MHSANSSMLCCMPLQQAMSCEFAAGSIVTRPPRPWQRETTLVQWHTARLPGSGLSAVGGTGGGRMIARQLV